jgi:hypothetical protein
MDIFMVFVCGIHPAQLFQSGMVFISANPSGDDDWGRIRCNKTD